MVDRQGSCLAIIGGGRWARVYLSELARMNLPYRLVLVSAHARPTDPTGELARSMGIFVLRDIPALLRAHAIAGAIVVNAAHAHFQAAHALLDAGIPVLLEKPAVMRRADAESLVAQAGRRGVGIHPALTMLEASYMERFAERVLAGGGPVERVRIKWRDPRQEVRYGVAKSYDPTISVAHDVMPHVWSILARVMATTPHRMTIDDCATDRGGRAVSFRLRFTNVRCDVHLERDASERRREVAVELETGETLSLDFTAEPGVITTPAGSEPGDPAWATSLRPVRRILSGFVARLTDQNDAGRSEVLRESVAVAELADLALKERQKHWLADVPVSVCGEDERYAIRELVVPPLLAGGEIDPGNRSALDDRVERLIRMVTDAPRAGNWMSALAGQVQ